MAEKTNYPQIPATVWWGVRELLQRSPKIKIDARILSVELKVQEAAAKQYVSELQKTRIIDSDGNATKIALRWRNDATYGESVNEIMKSIYPEELIGISPPDGGDREKVVGWFMHDGLGRGSAGNKAATYLLIGSPKPNQGPLKAGGQKPTGFAKAVQKAEVKQQVARRQPRHTGNGSPANRPSSDIPLNINVQIHISSDASADQIEAIFSAMRQYLYAKED